MFHFSFIIIDSSIFDGDYSATLTYLKSCGYAGVELNLTPRLVEQLDEIEPVLRDNDLVVPAMLTGGAYAQGLCLSSPDADVRQRTVQRLISYLQPARRFDAILVVGLLQGFATDEPDTGKANERIAAGLREVGLAAMREGVELVIEPVNHLQVGFNHSLAEVQALIAAIDVPAVRPMLDTIHMNIEETSLTEPVRRCGNTLGHVHLCESNGATLGSGHIDFKSVFEALDETGYDRFASVKVYRKAALEQGARSSMKFIRRQL